MKPLGAYIEEVRLNLLSLHKGGGSSDSDFGPTSVMGVLPNTN